MKDIILESIPYEEAEKVGRHPLYIKALCKNGFRLSPLSDKELKAVCNKRIDLIKRNAVKKSKGYAEIYKDKAIFWLKVDGWYGGRGEYVRFEPEKEERKVFLKIALDHASGAAPGTNQVERTVPKIFNY